MTAFDQFDPFERRITEAIDEIAAARTPLYLDDILRLTARTSQRRRWTTSERFRPMNRFSIAAFAAVLAVALVGGVYVLTRSTGPHVGATPNPTPSPTVTPTATPTPPAITAAAGPLLGDWVADVSLGLRDQGPRIQLSINWQDGKTAWIQTNYATGTQVFNSDSVAAPTGQLRLVAQQTNDGCTAGDTGTYAWNRSADGTFLTLQLVSDDCTTRSEALARTWVHTLSAVTDGGHGVLPVDNLELTLPARKFGLSGLANGVYDTTFDSTPYIEFLAIKDPTPFKVRCAAPLAKGTPIKTVADLLTYLKATPGFTITTTTGTIDGQPATHVSGSVKAGYTCAAGDAGMFYGDPDGNGNDTSWTLSNGNTEALSVWITQKGPDAYLVWYRGDRVTPADEAAVIGSIHFITQLPTP